MLQVKATLKAPGNTVATRSDTPDQSSALYPLPTALIPSAKSGDAPQEAVSDASHSRDEVTAPGQSVWQDHTGGGLSEQTMSDSHVVPRWYRSMPLRESDEQLPYDYEAAAHRINGGPRQEYFFKIFVSFCGGLLVLILLLLFYLVLRTPEA